LQVITQRQNPRRSLYSLSFVSTISACVINRTCLCQYEHLHSLSMMVRQQQTKEKNTRYGEKNSKTNIRTGNSSIWIFT